MENLFILVAFVLGVLVCLLSKSFFFKSQFKEKPKEIFECKIQELEKEKVNLQKKLKSATEQLGRAITLSGSESSNIESINEEIEELEDEISSLKRKIKRTNEEKDDLENQIFELNNLVNSTNQDKEEIQKSNDELCEKLNDFKVKIQETNSNLKFINDVINAKSTTNNEFEELDHKTWELYKFILDEVDKNWKDEAWVWRNEQLKSWINNKKVIAIVGEFSAGKTSIVNRILTSENPDAIQLPVNSKETTAIPTYISIGNEFNCNFYSPDSQLKVISPTTFQSVTKSTLDSLNVSYLIKYFVLKYKNEKLENLSILDTPGFGSNSEEIIKKTTEVVKEAHILFWIVDVNAGELNQSSLQVIKEHLHGIPLCIILNKSDQKSPKDLEILREKVIKTLEKNDLNVSQEMVITFHHKDDVNKLFKVINSIEISEKKCFLEQVENSLKKDLGSKRSVYKKSKIEEKEIYNDLEENIREMENALKISRQSLEDSQDLIIEKNSFWSGDYYKINKSDFNSYQNFLEVVKDSTFQMEEIFGALIEKEKKYQKKTEENKKILNEIKEFEHKLKRFLKFSADFQ